jgi:hypothetical protein
MLHRVRRDEAARNRALRFRWLQRWHARRRLAQALSTLDVTEVDRLLDLVGRRRSELFAAVPGTPPHRIRMGSMMRSFGMDVPHACATRWNSLVEAERRCIACANVPRCRRWLAWGRYNRAPWRFCPNARLFAALGKGECD